MRPRAVLKHGVGLVAGQAFALSVDREEIVAEAAQAAVRAHPQVAFAILEQAAHLIAGRVAPVRGVTKRSPSRRASPPLVPAQMLPSRSSQSARTKGSGRPSRTS